MDGVWRVRKCDQKPDVCHALIDETESYMPGMGA
jgi:hypothetical protein